MHMNCALRYPPMGTPLMFWFRTQPCLDPLSHQLLYCAYGIDFICPVIIGFVAHMDPFFEINLCRLVLCCADTSFSQLSRKGIKRWQASSPSFIQHLQQHPGNPTRVACPFSQLACQPPPLPPGHLFELYKQRACCIALGPRPHFLTQQPPPLLPTICLNCPSNALAALPLPHVPIS